MYLSLTFISTYTYTYTSASSTPSTSSTSFLTQIHHLPKHLYSTTHLQLTNNNYTYTTPITSTALATFSDVQSENTYTLNIHSLSHIFPTYTVTINSPNDVVVKSASGNNYGQVIENTNPLVIQPYIEAQYYHEREPMNYMSYLKNPMVIMMIITFAMIVIMPRLMNNMDPEELAAMKQQQQQFSIQGLMNSMQGNTAAPAPAAAGTTTGATQQARIQRR